MAPQLPCGLASESKVVGCTVIDMAGAYAASLAYGHIHAADWVLMLPSGQIGSIHLHPLPCSCQDHVRMVAGVAG